MEFELSDFESSETVESQTEETVEQVQEEQTESKAESQEDQTTGEKPESETEVKEQVENLAEEYKPDFTYKVKDETKEFPEWIRAAATSKEHEQELRDMFTKLDGFDGIKESRTKLEQDLNQYQEWANPRIEKIQAFDQALEVGDYNTAFNMAGIEHEKLVDSMLMDEQQSQLLYKKVLEQVQMEEQGPQAIEAKRQAHQEHLNTKKLEVDNQRLAEQISQIEANSFNQTLQFGLSQKQDVISNYDSRMGQGAFETLVRDYGHMNWVKGNKLTAQEAIDGAMKMAGLSAPLNTQTPSVDTPENVTQITDAKPAALPNVGGGHNVSVVSKMASTLDDYSKQLGNSGW